MTRHPELEPYLAVHRYGLGDLLHEQARSRPAMVAVVDGQHRFTFRELDERVNRLASVLRDRGVDHGDRLLWLGQNSFRVLEVLLAAARLGAIVAPANWRASAPEVSRTIEDLDPKIVFWQEAEIGEINRQSRGEWQHGRHWIQHDGEDAESYEALVAAGAPADGYGPVDISTPLLAIYTAAFSGVPGAALLSHESLLLTAMLAQQGQQIDETCGYLVSGPMFHVGVLMGALATFLAGGRCAFVARVDPEQLLDMIEADRLTHAYIPQPTVLQMRAANAARPRDISSLFATPDMQDWKMPMVMPASAPLLRRAGGYGQTEIGGLVVMLWLGGTGAGRTAPFLGIRIADDAGRDVPDGEVGEILARGPLVMCGYWRRPEENARRVINGWHRTNDLGRRLPDGSIAFTGPKTTMIKSALENIYPAEIEACLRQHEGVADVCVIGVPDPVWTQNVKAIIVRKPGTDYPEHSFIEHCRQHLASYKKPKIIAFDESLPRTPIGFVDRAAVDARHGGGNYPQVG
jgi:long-chain acyl-CoA synthetase